MKNFFLLTVKFIFAVWFLTGTLKAQKSVQDQKDISTDSVGKIQSMEPFVPTVTFPKTIVKPDDDLSNINSKAIRNFSKHYKHATNVYWSNQGKVITASFKEKGIQHTVFYLKNGRWLHTFIRYDATHLNDEVKSLVTNTYKNFDIAWVTEVHEGNMVSYFINIESPKEIKVVIAYDGTVAVYKEFKKSL